MHKNKLNMEIENKNKAYTRRVFLLSLKIKKNSTSIVLESNIITNKIFIMFN